VRSCRPAEQRLWLGPRRYRGCCGDTATNPGSDSYATSNGYSVRADNPNTYADFASCHTHADTYTEFTSCHTHADASFKSNANAYGEFTSSLTHADSYSDGYAKGAAKASADSASSAVSH
jgi:hypothetical protein